MQRINYVRKFNAENKLVFTTRCPHGLTSNDKKQYTRMIKGAPIIVEKEQLIKVHVGSESCFACRYCAGFEYTDGGYIMNCRYNEHN